MNTASSNSLLPANIVARISINEMNIHPVLSLSIIQKYGEHHRLSLRCYADSFQPDITLTIADQTAQLLGRIANIELANNNKPSSSSTLNARFIIAHVSLAGL